MRTCLFRTLVLPFLIAVPPDAVFPQAGTTAERARDLGVDVGILMPGPINAITDVSGVLVGHKTIIRGDSVRTGVTAVLPHSGNVFMEKVPAAIAVFNGFGKLAGLTQVEELGTMETPVVLTNTLSVGMCVEAVVQDVLSMEGNEEVGSVNAVVGETNDGYLNDIRGQHVTREDVVEAIRSASGGPVHEGTVGAGTGTRAFGFKGGIGTSSRVTPAIGGKEYTVGVLVQTNFGSELNILGVPFTRELMQGERQEGEAKKDNGSCMIVIATDAPLSARDLKRVAFRSFIGMGRTTAYMSSTSGDYAIAFSTAYRIPGSRREPTVPLPPLLDNNAINHVFRAVEEATQEAIYNSLFMATTVRGHRGHVAERIPIQQVVNLLKKYNLHHMGKRLGQLPY